MRIITFGEIMGRLTPPGHLRLRQGLPGSLNVSFAGAEANVAASLAMLGAEAAFVTALPRNVLADACVGMLRGLGVDTDEILRVETGRLGLYFLETGANQRPGQVVYDRSGSSISLTPPDQYGWDRILQNAGWLHVTGITPSLSQHAADSTLLAVERAKAAGCRVSCDLNFRKKLWRWDARQEPRELAEATMRQLLPSVDLLIANEADCADVLQIHAAGTDIEAGQLGIDQYPAVARELISQFPNISEVGITLRESISATHNNWGGMLFRRDEDRAYFAPLVEQRYQPYPIQFIVDRVGAGDAFAAGIIFASTTPELDEPQTVVSFAVAASCLAHSLLGDFNYSSRAEVEALMGGSTSGRVIR